jgi:hypothetical protein
MGGYLGVTDAVRMDKVASHNEHHLAQIRTALGR